MAGKKRQARAVTGSGTGGRRTAGRLTDAARYAGYCGTAAGLATMAAVTLAARAEGKPASQVINATSHWLWGAGAGRKSIPDLSHTLTGAVTNQAAAMFWGSIFGTYLAMRPNLGTPAIIRDAAILGAIASLVDYGLMPRRLTPGWELAVSRRSVALGMAAMAAGLAVGGVAARRRRT